MTDESVILGFQLFVDTGFEYVDFGGRKRPSRIRLVGNPGGSEKNSNGNVRHRYDERERIEYCVHKRSNGTVYGPFDWLHVRFT